MRMVGTRNCCSEDGDGSQAGYDVLAGGGRAVAIGGEG